MWPGKPGEAGSQVTAKSTGARAGPCASRAHRGLPRLGQRSWLPHGERARTPRRPGAGAGEDGSLLRCRVPDGGVETRLITAAEPCASQTPRRRRDAISSQAELTHGGDRQVNRAGAEENRESHPDVSEMHLSGSLLTAPERHTGNVMPFLEFGRWPARVTGNFR